MLDEELKEQHIFTIDFEYPIKFDPAILAGFMEAVKGAPINQLLYLKHNVTNSDKLYPILIYGSVNKMFDFGFEPGKGYWFKKLKEIEIK